jgi:hypothetical protein
MANNRSKGIRYEQKVCNELNELGFNVRSTRELSKFYDDHKVDILDHPESEVKIPHHVQCKSTSTKPKYEEILNEFKLKDKPLVIFHKSTKKVNKNFKTLGEYVIMDKELYYEILKLLKQQSNV